MQAGKLNKQVFADEPVVTHSDTGAEITTWKLHRPFWCSIEPIGGREAARAGQLLAEMDTRITARWSPLAARITATWRLRLVRDGVTTVYNIARPPAEKQMARQEIEFMCASGVLGE